MVMLVKIKRRQYSDSQGLDQGKDELGLRDFNNKQNAEDFKNAAESALNDVNNHGSN